jgi:site-specific recombinase XerD
MKSKLNTYVTKCSNLKDHKRVIPLDDIGRKALKAYFKKNKDKVPERDSKLLSIIEAYLFMCKCRREKGEAYS